MDLNLSLESGKAPDFNKVYDLVIIGLGPAGYSAGIYATRFNLDVLMIGYEQGGLVSETPFIENYPGVDEVDGFGLAELFKKQYLRLGGAWHQDHIISIVKKSNIFEMQTEAGHLIKAKSVIAATGLKRRKLDAKGELELSGKGISYCATCDAALFRNKSVAVVGGGDSAFTAAIHLSQFAKKIYVVHRREEFRAQPSLVDRMKDKSEFIMNKSVLEFSGSPTLKKATLKDNSTGKISEIEIDGCFVEIGYEPTSKLFESIGVKTEDGFIVVSEDMKTNVSGFFAAGDCTNGLNGMKQIITAAAMGAIASESVYKYVNGLDESKTISEWKH